MESLKGLKARKAALEYMKNNPKFQEKDIIVVSENYGVAVIGELEKINAVEMYIRGRGFVKNAAIIEYLSSETGERIKEIERNKADMQFQKDCMEASMKASKRANRIAIAAIIVSIISAACQAIAGLLS